MPTPFTALVLAAGKGTRMKSERAKVLHELAGRPLAWFPVAKALEAGAGRVVVVVGHQAEAVETRLTALFPEGLSFAHQAEQRGTGHAVMAARDEAGLGDGDVVVLSGDVPLLTSATIRRVVEARRRSGVPIALVTSRPPDPAGYGRVVTDPSGHVERIVEQRDATGDERAIGQVNAGLYCFDGAFLASQLQRLTSRNAQGEYYLTDLVGLAREAGRMVACIEAPHTEMAGINDRAELADAGGVLRRELNRSHLRAGVTMADPSSTAIDLTVTLAQDVELGPQVSLHGTTRVGRGSRIGQGCVLVDSVVGEGVELKPYSHLEGAVVGDRCAIGPFARLRPGTELADEVHIGNFVETKKARIGRKSKANHLAYLGDAVIGQGCNVGAGTITCNYDGVHKHETRLGDGVFIGSDTQLVAPVTLGDGAYVGAGSTITKDVPPDALAFSRAPQLVKEGWAQRRRQKLSTRNS
jgi:bifunctional UDP-N-acetylglucosamine pyrophosphorylase/glucosamine-1-phosphate N-acetyltransferase